MKFEKYTAIGRKLKPKTLIIGKSGIGISIEAWRTIGEPRRADIYYSTKGNAIKLVESPTGRLINFQFQNGRIKTYGFCKIMPIGTYRLNLDKIFILEP